MFAKIVSDWNTAQKLSFLLLISSVNVTKEEISDRKLHFCAMEAVNYFHKNLHLKCLHIRRLCIFQDHQKFCQMQIEQCDCGEKFLLSQVPTEVLNHWKHQTKCIFSYIGCVSYALCLFVSFLSLMESCG